MGRQDQFKTIIHKLASSTDAEGYKRGSIWMHCASLGEFEQGRPILERIRKEYPAYRLVVTFYSPSGYEVRKNYPGADIFYLPVDSAHNAAKFISLIDPKFVIWIKYEYWYYYLAELNRLNIPVILISATFRRSQPFFKWYGGLWRKMLGFFDHIFIQHENYLTLLSIINVSGNVTVSGDTRFDRVIEIAENFEPVPFVEGFCGGHRVIVAGSTWEDDEALFVHYSKSNPEIKFIIVPHEVHKENIKDVQKEFPNGVLYSALEKEYPKEKNVLIIDNIGLLARLYKYADITYVGGGFGYEGLHNILEAAVYGKPVLYGPEVDKNPEALELVEADAGIFIDHAIELEGTIDGLFSHEAELTRRSEAARNFVYARAGATEKIMEYIRAENLLLCIND